MALKEFRQLEDRLKSSMISVGSVKKEACILISRGDKLVNKIHDKKANLQEMAEFGEIVRDINMLLNFAELEDEELKNLEEGYGKL